MYLHLEKNTSRRFEIDWVCKAQWSQFYSEEEFLFIFSPLFYEIRITLLIVFQAILHALGLKIFAQGGLFMKQNANVPEGGNEGGKVATPTSISIFDSYGMKRLWLKFGHDIFTDLKMPRL